MDNFDSLGILDEEVLLITDPPCANTTILRTPLPQDLITEYMKIQIS